MRLTLKQMILNALELNNHDKNLMAEVKKVCGYANLENFKKTLKKEAGDIEKIDGFLRVVRILFKENHIELIREFTKTLNPDTITARLMLEVATLYHDNETKLILIDLLESSSKAESKEWAYVYKIDHMIGEKEISYFEGLNLLNSKKYTKPEAKAYSKIAQIYCYYDMRNLPMVKFSLEEIEKDIEVIKNQFIRQSYLGRVYGLKVDMDLHSENIGELIQNVFLIENAPSPLKAKAYLQIGNSYMLKSYDKAMHYLNLAMEYKTPTIQKSIVSSLNFVSLLWNKPENYIQEDSLSNELFYYVRKGNKSEALRTIDKIDFEALTDHQKAFNCFYKGLLFGDKTYFYKSVEYFNKVGEKFYKQLPIMELKKQGENEMVLLALGA